MKRLMFLFAVLAIPFQLFAYGGDAHRVIGYMAQPFLLPDAKARLNEILPRGDLGEIAGWMDEEGRAELAGFPNSQEWHFMHLAVCGDQPPAHKCPHGDCLLKKFEEYREIFADRSRPKEERAFALKVIVHLIGDLHQPLHMADNNDRDGNGIRIAGGSTLHKQWDTDLLRPLFSQHKPRAVAALLLSRFKDELPGMQWGMPEQWVQESHELGVRAYRSLPGFSCDAKIKQYPALPREYVAASRAVEERQLARAGVRLARVINEALLAGR